jgi:hypothetical protein
MSLNTVFEAIQKLGHDEDFEPQSNPLFFPTIFSPGSNQKIEVLRQRVELGLPLWHEDDEKVCNVTGVGSDKQKPQVAMYGKTARYFASRRNKMLSD